MLIKFVFVDEEWLEVKWIKIEFEEYVFVDFVLGGRYGNEIVKGLVVSINLIVKLCG